MTAKVPLRLILEPYRWPIGGLAAVVIVFTLLIVFRGVHGWIGDVRVWHKAGAAVLQGNSPSVVSNYHYPPTFAILIAPLALLGRTEAAVVWFGVNVVSYLASALLAARLVTGAWLPADRRVLVYPSLLAADFVMENFNLGQVNLLITALIYLGLYLFHSRRHVAAGMVIGLAAALKVFPILLLPYFVYRRAWRVVAGALAGVVVFLVLLPLSVLGPIAGWAELRGVAQRVVVPYATTGEATDFGKSGRDIRNQSLSAVLDRLLKPVEAFKIGETPVYVNIVTLRDVQARLAKVGVAAVLVSLFVLAMRKRHSQSVESMEYAMLCLLVLFLSGVTWAYFFCLLLLPFTVAVHHLLSVNRYAARWVVFHACTVAAVVLCVLEPIRYMQAIGNFFWASLVLYGGFAALMRSSNGVVHRQSDQPRVG